MNSMSGQKLKGIPYTGTLPAVLTGTKAGYLHRYKVYGNTEQTGTPTPENPIEPSECGERTGNLLSFADLMTAPEGTIGSVTFPHVLEITLEPNTRYTMYANGYGSSEGTADTNRSLYFDGTDNKLNCVYANHPSTKTTGSTGVVKIGFMSQRTNAQQYINNTAQTWLNLSSTPLPYEPYGYKLPLTSAGQNVDIYLGESQTTRWIKKLVLTGEETWSYESSVGRFGAFIANFKSLGVRLTPFVTDRYVVVDDGRAIANVPDNAAYTGAASTTQDGTYLYIHTSAYSSTNDFKTYLAQEYANGTPVTVWCILTTPTTGTLNEPLRKIGNYADTIDSTQTTAQIPTTAGSTTISWAGSGLAPSEFDSVQEWVDIPTYKRVNGEWAEE